MSMKRTRDRTVIALVNEWKTRLGLEAWDFTIEINRRAEQTDEEPDEELEGSCTVSDGYLHADLVFNLFRIKSRESLELTVVHELCHVILRPLELAAGCYRTGKHQEVACEARERAATMLSRAFFKSRKA
jgi:hypothetical protein